MDNYFMELNSVDVSEKIEKKGKLTYLSWAWAWGELKKRHPDATSTVYETENGMNYFNDGKTAWVKVGVTVNGIEHIEYLPVMDMGNQKSMPLERVTSWDVNKAIQRAITKAIARHGLGLYIYAGEDLPEDEKPKKGKKEEVETISFGTANSEDTDLPFDVGEPETGTGEPVELLGLRSLMKMDGVTEKQVLDAFKGKYSAIENIEPGVIQEMLLDKWESFVKFINKGGNKK